tara:strand:- start:418 stop:636 length:219 start_codon:yes stop_codon:yes gene_type:complete
VKKLETKIRRDVELRREVETKKIEAKIRQEELQRNILEWWRLTDKMLKGRAWESEAEEGNKKRFGLTSKDRK